ncbi:MAG: succinate dehydrogenase cytochrome b subunit, partial [Clostridia bacterium]|nr:succinate dehydrogenase cytochrome b subunit [Deltaproteobacteria bacterium]
QVFLGPEALNHYAAFLKSLGGLLWLARGILLVAVFAHIGSGIRLAYLNTKARPERYRVQKSMHTNLFAKTMALSGLTLLAFIVYHLLHFTFGVTNAETYGLEDSLGRHDVYAMVVGSFANPAISGVYVVSMALLGMHLSHGCSSFFQSLGLNHPKYNGLIQKVGPTLGILIFIGNAAMPVAVLLGLVTLH